MKEITVKAGEMINAFNKVVNRLDQDRNEFVTTIGGLQVRKNDLYKSHFTAHNRIQMAGDNFKHIDKIYKKLSKKSENNFRYSVQTSGKSCIRDGSFLHHVV